MPGRGNRQKFCYTFYNGNNYSFNYTHLLKLSAQHKIKRRHICCIASITFQLLDIYTVVSFGFLKMANISITSPASIKIGAMVILVVL